MTVATDKTVLIEKIKDLVYQSGAIETAQIEFSHLVEEACKRNYCGLYNKNWSCPPNIGTFDELKEKCLKYKYALVFTTFDSISDSFDFEGMMRVRKRHDEIQEKVFKALSLKDSYMLGAGGCRLCEKCNFPNPCRFPHKRISSIESHGINVVDLSSKLNINYCNGENTVTYFSIIFYN